MIDFIEAYPNPQQFEEFDCEDEYKERFDFYVNMYNKSKNVTFSVPAVIESEIRKIEGRRDNIKYSQQTRTPDGISLHPLFIQGWEFAIHIGGVVLNNCYKHCPEIVEQISAKYNEHDPPPNYFEILSKISMEEVIEGMACAKYYYWLKDQKNKEEQSISNISSKFSLKQLLFIFNEMVKLKNFEMSQKQLFLDTFQGNTEIKQLRWKGKKSLIRYFFQQMTDRDDITPTEIRKYITPTIDSNDKHTGSSHHPIRDVINKAKGIK